MKRYRTVSLFLHAKNGRVRRDAGTTASGCDPYDVFMSIRICGRRTTGALPIGCNWSYSVRLYKMAGGGKSLRFSTSCVWVAGMAAGHATLVINVKRLLCVLYFFNNSLESGGVVESEVGEHLAVDLDTCFVDQAHKL